MNFSKRIGCIFILLNACFLTFHSAHADDELVITSQPSLTIAEGEQYEYQVVVSALDDDDDDDDGRYLFYRLVSAPNGMTIDNAGLIRWLPNYDQAGSYDILVEVLGGDDDQDCDDGDDDDRDDGKNRDAGDDNSQDDDGRDDDDDDDECDGGSKLQQQFTLVVSNTNRAPVLNPIPAQFIEENQLVVIELSASDADGDSLSFSANSLPDFVSLQGNQLSFSPDFEDAGEYGSIEITVSDGIETASQSFTLVIINVNSAPVANDLDIELNEDTSASILLTATDADGDTLTLTLESSPSNGLLSGTVPNLVYSPNPDFFGTDAFAYRANDGSVNSNLAIVLLTVLPVNDQPTAQGTSVETDEDIAVSIQLQGSDIDDDSLSFVVIDQPANGSVSIQNDQAIYTPAANFSGIDSFTFAANDGFLNSSPALVNLRVNPLNDAPTANQINLTTDEATPVDALLSGADSEGDAISFRITSQPSNGWLLGIAPNLLYIPDAGFTGSDSFQYLVNDGQLDSEVASVVIEVLPFNSCTATGAVQLRYTDFTDITDLQLNGSTATLTPNSKNALRLTEFLNQGGSAFARDPIPLVKDGNFLASFSTTFSFQIENPIGISDSDGQGADGIVFILQTVANNVGGIGGGIGYAGLSNSLGIEFDTYNNGSIDQNSGNHIGINFNGDIRSSIVQPIPDRFNDGAIRYVWIDYDGEQKQLEVRLASSNNRPTDAVVIATDVDLPNILGTENAYVGFSSGTAAAGGQHDILSFQFINQYAPTGECGNRLPYFTSEPVIDHVLQPIVGSSEPIDLRSWQVIQYADSQHVSPNWVINADGTEVIQRNNADPSILLSDFILSNGQVKGRFYVESNFDDDFIGFVFGYQDSNNFYIFDWKKNDQNAGYQGIGLRGMRVKSFSGDSRPIDFWTSNPTDAEVLYSNVIAWNYNTAYEFTLDFFPGEFAISVNEVDSGTVLDSFTINDDTFPSGGFGFYNYSQQQVRYQGFDLEVSANREYIYPVVAADPDGDALSYRLTQSPAGMTIDSATGEIRWFTTTDDIGEYTITVEVSDGAGGAALQTYQLIVTNSVPVITTEPVISAETGRLYSYNVDASDPTPGDQLTYSLLRNPDGMSINPITGIVEWIPLLSDIGSYPVEVSVEDIAGGYDRQRYLLTVVESSGNASPVITSTAVERAQVGFEYRYPIVASDADGDPLSYLLTQAPAGMTIDPLSGLITWIPDANQAGQHQIALRATDGIGGYATQFYAVTVLTDADNQAPVISSTPATYVLINQQYGYQIVATDGDGDAISFQLLDAPAGMTLSPTGLLSWSSSTIRSEIVTIRAYDGAAYAEQQWIVTVSDGVLRGTLELSPRVTEEGGTITIQVRPSIVPTPVTVSLTVDGQSVPVDADFSAQVVATGVGAHIVTATVTNQVSSLTLTDRFLVRDPTDTEPPVVAITAPVDGELVTALADIYGSVSDTNLLSWKLMVGRSDANASQMRTIVEATDERVDAILGVFDPSLLDNGQYKIVLQAEDANGLVAQDSVTVTVEGEFKIGNFSFTIEDLSIPLAGMPITVSRTYDSRRRQENLDFGYGWSVDYQDAEVEESAVPGTRWRRYGSSSGFIPLSCFEAISPRPVVSVKLPTGEVERFEAGGEAVCTIIPISIPLTFSAIGDNQSTLQALNENSGFFLEGELQGALTGRPLNPSLYRLTTREGFVYDLDENFGILTVTDPNGNKLDYGYSSITHSSGKSVSFVRDINGRITRVVDPAGNAIRYNYDAAGDLIRVIERDDATTTHSYYGRNCATEQASANCHLLDEMIDPLGRRVVRNIFDDSGRLIAQEDQNGNRIEYSHDVEGRQSVVTDRNGNSTVMYYDERGNVTSAVDALGNSTYSNYDERDNLLSMTNELGHTITSTYSLSNDILSKTDALGNTESYSYNSRGYRTQALDALGRTFNQTFDDNGNLLSLQNPDGNSIETVIDSRGLPSAVRDLLGNETVYTFDNDGKKISETDPLGAVTTFTYDDNKNVLTETRTRTVDGVQNLETTTYVYDNRNRAIQMIDRLGHSSYTEYDLAGNKTAMVDALGRHIEMNYDVFNNIIETRYPDGTRENYSYDAEQNRVSMTDRLGRLTQYSYDPLNRLIATIHADGSSSQMEYDAIDRIIADIDERGNRTGYEYDAADRRTAIVDAVGNRISFTYDAVGNVSSETDTRGYTTYFVYDAMNRLVQTIHPDNTELGHDYDAESRPVIRVDESGSTTYFDYDANSYLLGVTDALGQVTSYSYDEWGNKLTQTDAEGRVTRWKYDALGRVISRTLPLMQRESFNYDSVGNITEHADFGGAVHFYTYDVNNRLISTDYADGSAEHFTYNSVGNRLSSAIEDAQGVRVWYYEYDNRDRLQREVKPDGAILEYRYDLAGNKASLKTSLGVNVFTESYQYDQLNRLQTVNNENGQTDYTYDQEGNQTRVVYANGNVAFYTYDNRNRLIQLTNEDGIGNSLTAYDYELGATGTRARITEPSGRVSSYLYDELYRLVEESVVDVSNGNYSASYGYDKVGNRTQTIVDGVTAIYIYDDNDRLIQSGDATYNHDELGNTIEEISSGLTITYRYNSQNELIEVVDSSGSSLYDYNTDGVRTSKTDTVGSTTNFFVDHNRDYSQVLGEFQNGDQIARYFYGRDLLSQQRADTAAFYLYDGLGSTRALADGSGVVTDTYNYEAFGELLNKTGATDNDFLFTGEQLDKELGLYYLRARYYDPTTGRFTRMDSWMGEDLSPESLNKYAYALNDPVLYVDFTGNNSSISTLNLQAGILGRNGLRVSVKKIAKQGFCVAVEEIAVKGITTGIYLLLDGPKIYVGETGDSYDRRYNKHLNDARKNILTTLARLDFDGTKEWRNILEQFFKEFIETEFNTRTSNRANPVAQNPRSHRRQKLRAIVDKLKMCK